MSLTPELASLENAGLIRLAVTAPDLAYAFRHGLIQDAAYATLLRAQREAWHLAAAEVLEAAYLAGRHSDLSALPPILAHHFSCAGHDPRALHYLVLAGDAAFNRYANIEAIDFYSRALAIAVSPNSGASPAALAHLFARLGRALELTSQFTAALDHYRRQEALAQHKGDPALELASLTASATVLSTANFVLDVDRAVGLLERARRLARQSGDRAAEAKISWTLLLNNAMSGGPLAERIEHGERALRLALELGERELLAFIYNDLFFAYAGTSRWPQALTTLTAGQAISREIGNLPALCENLTRTAIYHLTVGDYAEALVAVDQAEELAEALQSTDFRALVRAFAGLIHLDRGDLDRAIEICHASITWGQTSGNVTVLIGTRSELARAYALLGALDEAQALAQASLALASDKFPMLIFWSQSALIRLHVLRGDLAEAEAIRVSTRDYRDLQQRLGHLIPMWGNLALANLELVLAQGQFETARAEAAELILRLEASGVRYLLPEARLNWGRALLAQGRLAEAQAALLTARQAAQTIGSRRILWPVLEALAALADRTHAPAEAAALRREARAIVDHIAAHTPTAALRNSFLATPAVRALMAAI